MVVEEDNDATVISGWNILDNHQVMKNNTQTEKKRFMALFNLVHIVF